jgi:hypothetical protein
MDYANNSHYSYLRESYEKVARNTWQGTDFGQADLDISRNLFTDESLKIRKPRPRNLEVYALLSGLPFNKNFSDRLVDIQKRISIVLDDRLHYWVFPSNLGVEYCVFKWPSQNWKESQSQVIMQELSLLDYPSFRFTIHGIQVNPDGCIIAKGYDEDGMMFNIRKHLKDNLLFLPKKQSGWAHVPIGRILEPLGESKFSELKSLICELSDVFIATDKIDSLKFVHESRWYMEEKSILSEIGLK